MPINPCLTNALYRSSENRVDYSSVLVMDTFTGTDGTPLSSHTPDYLRSGLASWSQVVSTEFEIISNTARATTFEEPYPSDGTFFFNIIETITESDVEGQALVTTHVDNVSYIGGFLLRYEDENNYLSLLLNSSTMNVVLSEKVGGVESVLSILPISWTRGDTLLLKFRCIGQKIEFGVSSNEDYWATCFTDAHEYETAWGIIGQTKLTGSTKFDNLQFRISSSDVYSTPRLRWLAEDGVYKLNGSECAVDGDDVYFIADLSQNRSSGCQPTAAITPQYKTNVYNTSHPAWECDSITENFIRGTTSIDSSGISIFLHYSPLSTTFGLDDLGILEMSGMGLYPGNSSASLIHKSLPGPYTPWGLAEGWWGSYTETNLLLATLNVVVPVDSVIEGILVSYQRFALGTGDNCSVDKVVQLYDINGGLIGDNKADSITTWQYQIPENVSYGSPTDTWGAGVTAAQLNSGSIGVAIAARPVVWGGEPKFGNMMVRVYYRDEGTDGMALKHYAVDGELHLEYTGNGDTSLENIGVTDDGNWHKISLSFDFLTGEQIIRADGVTTAIKVSQPGWNMEYADVFCPTISPMNCYIRELRIYNIPMSESDMILIESQVD